MKCGKNGEKKMAITLGTNIPAYTTRMNLNGVTSNLTTTMERLSTGLKINKAGDDAAGLVISENMEAFIRSSKQAMNNIQTAEGYLTVAEDGMVSISDHFQRINDLLTNMANDTNDIESRLAAVREIIERLDEINRLAETTNFNGRTMLDGSAENTEIIVQMGPDETELSILDITPALTDCHVEALDAVLPGNLNPEARAKVDTSVTPNKTTIYIPVEKTNDDGTKTTEYINEETLGTGTEEKITETEFLALPEGSAFDPSNENCRAYMKNVKSAISEIATRRGLLGAYENRMQSSYDSMSTRIESLEAAKGIYTDTDIAEEATNLTSQQIMQQINVAILSSANSMQQTALSLLGG